jgi:hypothetical protein
LGGIVLVVEGLVDVEVTEAEFKCDGFRENMSIAVIAITIANAPTPTAMNGTFLDFTG